MGVWGFGHTENLSSDVGRPSSFIFQAKPVLAAIRLTVPSPGQGCEGDLRRGPASLVPWPDVTVSTLDLPPYYLTWDLFNGPPCTVPLVPTTQDLPGHTLPWGPREKRLHTEPSRLREPLITGFFLGAGRSLQLPGASSANETLPQALKVGRLELDG